LDPNFDEDLRRSPKRGKSLSLPDFPRAGGSQLESRLRILHELGFIDLKGGASGDASYALIPQSLQVIQAHHDKKTPGMREDKYNALVARAIELGDVSLAPPAAPIVANAPAPPFAFPMPHGWTPPAPPPPPPAPPAEMPKAEGTKS